MKQMKLLGNGARRLPKSCIKQFTLSMRYCTVLQAQAPLDPLPKLDHTPLTDRLTGNPSDTISSSSYLINPKRAGRVTDITNTIATVEGFTSAKPHTVVEFDNGVRGLVLSVDNNGCNIGILDHGTKGSLLRPSDSIRLDNVANFNMKSPSTIVGPGTVGRIVDVYGNDFLYEQNQPYTPPPPPRSSLDNASYSDPVYSVNLFPNSKYVTTWNTYSRHRARIHTGIKSLDTFYPMARGQRTAVIGGPHHRKSELAIDILLSFLTHNDSTENMRDKMFGVYVMIGKPVDEIWRLYRILKDSGALEYSTIVASRSDDLMTKQMLTPYTGAAIADFYKFYGMNSFIIYDDFTVHNRICSKIYRESNGLMTYGNWSGELLERASQLNDKYGGGSHTALCLADRPQDDDELNVESETFYNYLPHLVSHVDGHIMLSDESFDQGLMPPISLFPVPYGTPKFMKHSTAKTTEQKKYNEILLRLSIGVKRILFELVELEQAARQQLELGLDLEPDVQRISSNVYKTQILFTQNEEINTEQLVLMLLCLNHRIMEYVHLDKIKMVEQRMYQYFIGANNERWNRVRGMITEKGDAFDFEHDEDSMQLIHDFLDDNDDLCRPNALSEQDLEEPHSEFY